jgi:hypothetical protein
MRQHLLALVQARLDRFSVDHDPAAILDPEAVAELTALLETVPDPAADLEIARVAGWMHWWRYLVLDPDDDQQELDEALAFFVPLYQADPDAVPDRVRTFLRGLTASDDLHAEAYPVMREALRIGDLAMLDRAIDMLQQAVAAAPLSHPDRPTMLSNLAIALTARAVRTWDQVDLDAAVDAGQQAVEAAPADDSLRAGRLDILGVALTARSERTGDQADLDAAVRICRQAVEATPAGDPRRGGRLSTLSNALIAWFEKTGDQADLDAAVDAGQQAVAATPAGDPLRGGLLSALGNALAARFGQTGDQADLDAAVDAGQQAVAAIPADDYDRAGWLFILGNTLRIRFEQTGDHADLDAAIIVGRQAVAATPAGNYNRAERLSTLANALAARFEHARDQADLDAAIIAGRQAVEVEVASPRVRGAAARDWGSAAASGRRWQEAVAGFTAAAALLELAAPRSLIRGDQEHLMKELGSQGADAAACCVQAGLTDRAVELFEQGRAVLLGQALDTRTDLTALAEQHPGLATQFTALRDNLDQAGKDGAAAADGAEAASRARERRLAAAAGFGRVIAEIRQLPDFHDFLRPPPVTELLAAAAEGPVAAIAVSRFGSHALILTSGGVLDPVALPGLTPETLYDQVIAFLSVFDAEVAAGQDAVEQQLADTLGWLWDEVAGPVLDRLGITGPPRDCQPWPRLWWCASGLLSFLPLHAAGHHHTWTDASPATVIDRVISSYTPTIRALTHARRPATVDATGGRPGTGVQIVAVAMPHTPGASDLPGAQAETSWLQLRFPGQVTVLTGTQATHDTVLAALPAGQWAHFACHADSDLRNPSASCLLLTDHQQRPLTVMDVARLRLDGARLAFLSACSTARPGAQLTDEAIHLASAFQLAGYRHVIATLWPIGDQHAVDIAKNIYTTLTSADEGDVASAGHATTLWMRKLWGWDRPSVWASHIHVGA